jgi:hypothetical protein
VVLGIDAACTGLGCLKLVALAMDLFSKNKLNGEKQKKDIASVDVFTVSYSFASSNSQNYIMRR